MIASMNLHNIKGFKLTAPHTSITDSGRQFDSVTLEVEAEDGSRFEVTMFAEAGVFTIPVLPEFPHDEPACEGAGI